MVGKDLAVSPQAPQSVGSGSLGEPQEPEDDRRARGSYPFPSRLDRKRLDGARGKQPKWRFNLHVLPAVIFALAGLAVVTYPSTAAWWSQYHESKAISSYIGEVSGHREPDNATRLAQAREYNEKLSAGDIDIGGENHIPLVSDGGDEDLDYWKILDSDSGLMGRLKIPSIDVDLPIYHGTSDDVLAHGVGHLQGTSLPVGGKNTHSVLTAHTGLSTATLFNDLKKVKLGDTFTIGVAGEVLTYEAIETQTVLPNETGSLVIREDEDIVTLVTCTPLGINTHRYLVTGERVFPTPEEDIDAAGKDPEVPRFPWWAVIQVGGVALVGVLIWRSGLPKKE